MSEAKQKQKEKEVEIEDENLEPVEFEKITEQTLTRKARQFLDILRHVELYAQLEATQSALNAYKKSDREVAKLAVELAKEHIKDFLAGRKPPRTWGFTIGKWTALIIIVIIICITLIIII